MKVLYIVTAYPRDPTDVITPWLVETILRLRPRGVEVEVLAPAYRGSARQVIDGVTVHRFRYAPQRWETLTHDQTTPDRIRERPAYLGLVPGYVLAGTLEARRLARSGEFGLVHVFWPLPHGLLGLAAKRAAKIPLVCTFFGVELTWMESQLPFLSPLLRRIVRGSNAVTAISSYTADRLQQAVPGVRAEIIPFGAAIEPADTLHAPSGRAGSGRVGQEFELLFVGRLVERKGVHLLLEALAALGGSADRIRLRVVGDGAERKSLEQQAEHLGITRQVVFEGYVSREVLAERFVECDGFVLPAVVDAKGDTEGLGVVLLEAMSYGKPVIASATGGITDIVRDGRNGYLVPPGDPHLLASAIQRLVGNPDAGRLLGAQGRLDVEERFSWPVILDRLETLYRELVASSPGVQTAPALDNDKTD